MDLNLLLEAEKRGILPEEKVNLLNEARGRGLIRESITPLQPQEDISVEAPKDLYTNWWVNKAHRSSNPTKIVNEADGKTYSVNPEHTALFAEYLGDDVFDNFSGLDSSVTSEIIANTEKQAAYLGLAAFAFGAVEADGIAEFVANRSKALANANSRQPMYMKRGNQAWEGANGFFETLAVPISNPKWFGRIIATQAPNSIIPMVSSIATGAGTGFNPIAMKLGQGGGNLIVSTAQKIDEILSEDGIDITNPLAFINAANNKEYMNEVKLRAIKKGAALSATEFLIDAIGNRLVPKIAKTKLGRGASEFAFETLGEGGGEAAGQLASDGKIDVKDVALEMISAIGQSGAMSALSVATQTAGKGVDMVTRPSDIQQSTEVQQDRNITEIKELPPLVNIEDETTTLEQPNISEETVDTSIEATDIKSIEKELIESIKDISPDEIIQEARVTKIAEELVNIENSIDSLEKQYLEKFADEKPVKNIESKIKKLQEQRFNLELERDGISLVDLSNKDVQLKGRDITRMAKEQNLAEKKAISKGFRKGIIEAKKDFTKGLSIIKRTIAKLGLTRDEKRVLTAKMEALKTSANAVKKLPSIYKEAIDMVSSREKSLVINKIRKRINKVRSSGSIAIDFIDRIESLIDDIDINKRSKNEQVKLEKLLDVVSSGKVSEATLPKKLIANLREISKKNISELTNDDLINIYDELINLESLGRLKKELMDTKKKRKFDKELKMLLETATTTADQKAWSENSTTKQISTLDSFLNKFNKVRDGYIKRKLKVSTVDVYMDILDGVRNFKGNAYKVLKKDFDTKFRRYSQRSYNSSKNLINYLKDNESLKEKYHSKRIGTWLILQQDGGKERLLANGISEAELDTLSLDDKEMGAAKIIRETLDAERPDLIEVLRLEYNKDLELVDNYFSMMVDYDNLNTLNVEDRFSFDKILGNNNLSPRKSKVEKGFTISRTGGVAPVEIDAFKVFFEHVDNVAYLIEVGPKIQEMSKLVNSKEYGDAIGVVAQTVLKDWVDVCARKGGSRKDTIKVLDFLRNNVGTATLAFKASTVFIQSTALFDGAAIMSNYATNSENKSTAIDAGEYVSYGLARVFKDDWSSFLIENMPDFRNRVGGDTSYSDVVKKDSIIPGYDKLVKAGYAGILYTDKKVAGAICIGAYKQYLDMNNIPLDLNNPNENALEYAQWVMNRSQGSGSFKDAPLILSTDGLTGNRSLDKVVLQFQTFVLNRWNIIRHDMIRLGIKEKDPRRAANVLLFLSMGALSETILREGSKYLVASLTGDDTDDLWDKEELTDDLIMNVAQTMPLANIFTSFTEYSSLPVPLLSKMNTFTTAKKNWSNSKNKETKDKWFWIMMAEGAGISAGLPGTTEFTSWLRRRGSKKSTSSKRLKIKRRKKN